MNEAIWFHRPWGYSVYKGRNSKNVSTPHANPLVLFGSFRLTIRVRNELIQTTLFLLGPTSLIYRGYVDTGWC
jgi:hypothetical protein